MTKPDKMILEGTERVLNEEEEDTVWEEEKTTGQSHLEAEELPSSRW